MQVKVSELTGDALDWVVVGKCEYDKLAALNIQYPKYARWYPKISPSTVWEHGGPILHREGFNLENLSDQRWLARHPTAIINNNPLCMVGDTQLIAAMRCYVAYKMGHEVEVPDSLVQLENTVL